MAWLQASIKELQTQIDDAIDSHPELKADGALIASIPGVGATSAAKALAYLGDVRRFKNGKALAAFIHARHSGAQAQAHHQSVWSTADPAV